jgi:cell division protein FtsI (penicillin-binding protein 3)
VTTTARTRKRGTRTDLVRIRVSRLVIALVLLAATGRLVQVQGVQAASLSAEAEQQRTITETVQGLRGTIADRNGISLAFSVSTRKLWMNPVVLREDWEANPGSYRALKLGGTYEEYTSRMAAKLHIAVGGRVPEAALLASIRSDRGHVVLADDVDPVLAADVVGLYPSIGSEVRQRRVYPSAPVGQGVVGTASWRTDATPPGMYGLSGLESSWDGRLRGADGKRIYQTARSRDFLELPGASRTVEQAVPGSNVRLTLDADLQHRAQSLLEDHVSLSGATAGAVIVVEVATGEVHALAVSGDLDPARTAFEPGAAASIAAEAAAVEQGVASPADVDAERFAALLDRCGLGESTGSGLPGETGGRLPPHNQWSAATLPGLVAGEGVEMTLLQLAGVYQAIGNEGLRLPPSVVKEERRADGTPVPLPRPDPVQVVSPQTARAALATLPETGETRAFPSSGVEGGSRYLDRGTGQTWLRDVFAGLVPAAEPRFAVAAVLHGQIADARARPVFHDVAADLVLRHGIPVPS